MDLKPPLMKLIATLCILFCLFLSSPGAGQGFGGSKNSGDSTKNFQFLPIPYLNYDRSLGFSIGAIPMAMYSLNKKDTISPESITGLFGMWTTNDSWFGMAFTKMFFKEDKWRIIAAGGAVSVNFQTYVDWPVGGFLDYNTGANFIMFEAQRRIIGKIFLGGHYSYSEFNTQFEGQPEPQNTVLNGLGLKLVRDSRDNVYYPRNGAESEIDWTNYPYFLNENDGGIDKMEMSHNQFISVRKAKDIVAIRAYVGFGIGELPFVQQFIVGQTDIRGYTQGQYRGNSIYTLQGEYRWNFAERLSAVGFFGMATIAGDNVEENNGKFLPGIGVGARYTVFKKNHFNVGIDAAVGIDDWGLYFRVGEAF
jgi:outer membrane protein assembly factor BamA